MTRALNPPRRLSVWSQRLGYCPATAGGWEASAFHFHKWLLPLLSWELAYRRKSVWQAGSYPAIRAKRPTEKSFVTYTDSETWSGNIHPAQALRQYRSEFVSDAKAVVVGMTSNGFTLADPNDRGMLDVVGFDTSVPAVIANFVRD
jgi:hypothetical protein